MNLFNKVVLKLYKNYRKKDLGDTAGDLGLWSFFLVIYSLSSLFFFEINVYALTLLIGIVIHNFIDCLIISYLLRKNFKRIEEKKFI